MTKKWVVVFWIAILMIGCMPHPRIDWMNSKYYGHIVDSNGKPIQDALVIVKNNNRRKSVVQVTQTDKNGEYEIKAKKTFMIFGAALALPPECTDELYVVHPLYNVYFKNQFNGRKYFDRVCTGMTFQKDFTLSKKVRRPSDYEQPSWDNVKVGLKLYDYDEQEKGRVTEVNTEKNIVVIEYDEKYYESQKRQTIEDLQSNWLVKKNGKL